MDQCQHLPAIKDQVVQNGIDDQSNLMRLWVGSGPPHMLVPCRPDISKEARVIAQSAKLEAGLVLIPETAEWREDLLHEVRAFPSGRYDDQVDSMTLFLWWTSCHGGLFWQGRMQNGGRPRGYTPRNRRPC
jgi:predicted phage terminase large subunit-like protein